MGMITKVPDGYSYGGKNIKIQQIREDAHSLAALILREYKRSSRYEYWEKHSKISLEEQNDEQEKGEKE